MQILRNGKPLVVFAQNASPWNTDILGFSRDRVDENGEVVKASRLGGKGCMPTSVAICTNLADELLDPRQVNELARRAGGYLFGTGIGVLERMAKSAKLVAPESLRVRELDANVVVDADVLRATIDTALLPANLANPTLGGFFVDGGFCIVNVDHTGDGIPDHFLPIVADHPDGGWWALDPAPGGPVHIGHDLKAKAQWGKVTKNYVVVGAAPIGKRLR